MTLKQQCENRGRFKVGHKSFVGFGKNAPRYYHGMNKTRPYSIWWSMITRCCKESSGSYLRYGAIGITVCDEWKKFDNFWKDMGDGYFNRATIDRIDNTKGYYKENCRWATIKEQARNKKSVKLYDFNGEKLVASEIDERLGFKKGTFRGRIKLGWSIEKALNTKLCH